MEPAAATIGAVDDKVVQEISPVRSKIATLANRSSFASFFVKNKKNNSQLKNDPASENSIKDDPSQNFDFNANDPKVNPYETLKDVGMIYEREEAPVKSSSVLIDYQIKSFEDQSKPCKDSTDTQQHVSYSPADEVNIISETNAVSTTRKRSNEAIVISDTEPVTVIDSDIEIIPPRRSQRAKTLKPPADIECISISSDDGDRKIITDLRRSNRISGATPSIPIIPLSDYSNMKKPDFTRPVRIPAENILISDSPEQKKVASRPVTIILNPPKSPVQSHTITVNTSIRLENTIPPNIINLNDLPSDNSRTRANVPPELLSIAQDGSIATFKRFDSVKEPAPKAVGSTAPSGHPVETSNTTTIVTPTIFNHIIHPVTVSAPVQAIIKTVNPKPAIPALVNANNPAPVNQAIFSQVSVQSPAPAPNVYSPYVAASSTASQVALHPATAPMTVNQVPTTKPVVRPSSQIPSQPAYVPVNRIPSNTSTSNTSPIKQKSAYSYIPRNFNDLDPSLREELMARLSQRENNSSAFNSSTPGITMTAKSAATTTTVTQTADKFVIFNIIQRLIPGTFDATKSATGKILPATSFTIIFKATDTFGSLKRKVAETLRVSPFDLVFTQESGGAGQSELFDTTRPSTLNIVGKTAEEYDQLKINIRSKQLPVNIPSKQQTINKPNNVTASASMTGPTSTPSDSATLPSLATDTSLPSTSTIKTAPTVTHLKTAQASFTVRLIPPETPAQVIPPSLIHRLYLYTKSSYNLYKSLQKTKKQQVYDSLTFLQTADEEMSKLSQDPVNKEDEDLLDSMDMKISQSQATASLITVNVKTASSRNQSHPIKISSAATISQLLQSFAAEYKITGTRIIFDGDVLRDTETIGNILEDDDMVEIK